MARLFDRNEAIFSNATSHTYPDEDIGMLGNVTDLSTASLDVSNAASPGIYWMLCIEETGLCATAHCKEGAITMDMWEGDSENQWWMFKENFQIESVLCKKKVMTANSLDGELFLGKRKESEGQWKQFALVNSDAGWWQLRPVPAEGLNMRFTIEGNKLRLAVNGNGNNQPWATEMIRRTYRN